MENMEQTVEETTEQTTEHLLPEGVVAMLANAIECLARHAWPKEPTSEPLSDILHRKRKSGSEAEKRFAEIALPLYRIYRKPAEHRPTTFSCSWQASISPFTINF